MHITALAGGVGGARFIRGLRHHLDTTPGLADSTVTVIANTGDDITLFGLRVCPDLDTLLYTLGDGVHEGQGWGRADESHRVQGELAAYGAVPQWFALGDLDFGTHIVRSQWLGQGASLSEVTARLAARWGLPEKRIELVPMTDVPVETHVVVDDDEGGERAIHFQEWWVRHQAAVPAHRFVGRRARPRHRRTGSARRDPPGRRRAAAAEQPGRVDRHHPRRARGARCVARHRCSRRRRLAAHLGPPGARPRRRVPRGHRGRDQRAAAVGGLYEDFLDGWLVDPADADTTLRRARVEVFDGPLLMSDVEATGRDRRARAAHRRRGARVTDPRMPLPSSAAASPSCRWWGWARWRPAPTWRACSSTPSGDRGTALRRRRLPRGVEQGRLQERSA